MIELLVWLAVLVIVAIAVFYILSQLQLPDPTGRILKVVVICVLAILAIVVLVQFTHVAAPLHVGYNLPFIGQGGTFPWA
jgi:hypothetical protein